MGQKNGKEKNNTLNGCRYYARTQETLDKHEVIHNLILVDDVWTVENKFLTPSMKIKRKTDVMPILCFM